MRHPKENTGRTEMASYVYVCKACGAIEHVPGGVIDFFDAMDPGDPGCPPTFQCQQCPGIMYPDWYLRAKRATP